MKIVRFVLPSLVSLTLGLASFSVLAKPGTSPKKFQSLDRMVAIVNNDTITTSELDYQTQLLLLRLRQNETELPPIAELKKQILERLIMEKLQLQIAAEAGIEIDDSTLNQTLHEIASRDGIPLEQMRGFLEEQGIPYNYFKDTVKKELTLSKLQQREVGQNITVSKVDIDNFLDSPQGQDKTGTEYRLGHILLSLSETPSPEEIQATKKQAEEMVKQLRAGANFSQMAMAKSAGQQALNGGDLGFRKGTEVPTLFAKQASLMQVNEVFGPIKNTSGFHIIKLLEKRGGSGAGDSKAYVSTHVRQILVKTNDKTSDRDAQLLLSNVRDQIAKGASFAKMAKKYSEETSSSGKGGDLGWVTQQSVVKPFYQEMSNLKPGQISQPFKTEMGWHLIQVEARKTQHNSSEAMRNKAMDILYQRKFDDQLASWLKQVREHAQVEIYSDAS